MSNPLRQVYNLIIRNILQRICLLVYIYNFICWIIKHIELLTNFYLQITNWKQQNIECVPNNNSSSNIANLYLRYIWILSEFMLILYFIENQRWPFQGPWIFTKLCIRCPIIVAMYTTWCLFHFHHGGICIIYHLPSCTYLCKVQ